MVPEPKLSPDIDAVSAHLSHITARWGELGEPVVLELVFLSADDHAAVKDVRRYPVERLAEAVDHVVGMNQYRVNAYAVVNPVRASAPLEAGTRASREHIAAAFFHWADADDAQAADNIRNFVGPQFTFLVLTGTQPCRRPHVYWELEEPTLNLDAWEKTQRAIAATLKTDRAVVDAPRIMRIGGTINWPKPKKQAKGYVAELTSVRFYGADERPPVTSERMARAFTGAAPDHRADSPQGGRQTLDRERAAIQALSGDGWHDAVIRLVGSYVRMGLKDDEVHTLTDPLTLPNYRVEDTRREVQAAIDGARRKGYQREDRERPDPEPNQFREMSDAEREAIEPFPFKPWGRRDLKAIPVPQFVYSDFYARGYTSVTLAAPKVGKSMLGLAEALDMASGRGFLTGQARPKVRVVYYNAEDDMAAIESRVAALLELYGIDQDEIADTFFPHSGVEEEDFFMVSGQDPVINEPLFVRLEKFCLAEKADALIFDPLQDLTRSPETNDVFRLLGQRLRRMASACRVAIGLVHHTRKVAAGIAPSIDDMRGGSALRGTARFNRILVSMTEDEAARAGVENHRFYFRIGDIESNLAPPSSDVNRWFEKVSVPTPNGWEFGAVRPWEWPDAMLGVSSQDAYEVQKVVRRLHLEGRPCRESVQSPNWVGHVVADVLGLDVAEKADKARVQTMLKAWIKSDVLMVESIRNTDKGRDVKFVLAGNNNPTTRETFE